MPTKYEGTAKEQLALNTFIKLQRAATTFQSVLTRKETIGPLTLSQFAVLEALYYNGPMCVGEIGNKVLKSDGNMTLVVDNLEKQGYVERHRDPNDRRLVRVHITESGKALIETIMPNHVATIEAMLSVLSAEEQQRLGELCRKLGISLTRTDEPDYG
jgi:MarR family 2-MHQ and catechol resistance regulon transcriptional repressor